MGLFKNGLNDIYLEEKGLLYMKKKLIERF